MNDVNNIDGTTGNGEKNEQQQTPSPDNQKNESPGGQEQQPTQQTAVVENKEPTPQQQNNKPEEEPAAPRVDGHDANDLFPNISDATTLGDEEKNMVVSLVKKFNDVGMTRQQAVDVFQELKKFANDGNDSPLDAEKIYAREMEKLGDERDTILSSLKSFSDTMVENRLWDGAKKQAFYDTITTADTARLFYDVIAHGNISRAGNFSHGSSSQSPSPQFSREERLDMYRKAFELAKANSVEGDLEIKRLDRLFGIK
jgi:hypothetical protein